MRQPNNTNFERMRFDAERQKLTDLEERSDKLRNMLEAQIEAAQNSNKVLMTENEALRKTFEAQIQSGNAKAEELEARCETLAALLAERTASEHQQYSEIKALSTALRSQAEAERASANAFEARCEALSETLRTQAETDVEVLNKVTLLQDQLRSDADRAREKASAIDVELTQLAQRIENADIASYSPERLRSFISPALTGALRQAGQDKPGELANTLAPHIIGTIKTEILNSEDELVEAIYPRMGLLIKLAIAKAMEDLNRKVDDALPFDRWIAALKGRLTGTPPIGWLLEDGTTFIVKEAMLIERQSGVLLAVERSTSDTLKDGNPDEDLMAGMIAALQGFASEAYGATGAGDLRRFSFTEDTVYLRGTPTQLMALRCSGIASPEIEARMDELLETALERMGNDTGDAALMLDDFNKPHDDNEGGVSGSKIMFGTLGIIALIVGLLWGHSAVTNAHEARRIATIEAVITDDMRLTAYPLAVTRQDRDSPFVISGLLPDRQSLDALKARLASSTATLNIELDIALVSGGN